MNWPGSADPLLNSRLPRLITVHSSKLLHARECVQYTRSQQARQPPKKYCKSRHRVIPREPPDLSSSAEDAALERWRAASSAELESGLPRENTPTSGSAAPRRRRTPSPSPSTPSALRLSGAKRERAVRAQHRAVCAVCAVVRARVVSAHSVWHARLRDCACKKCACFFERRERNGCAIMAWHQPRQHFSRDL